MLDTLRPWQLLLVQIRKIYEENPDNRNYGVGRVLLALEQRGVNASRSTVRRAMKKGGLLKAPARSSQSLTKADAAAQKAENLIHRDFTAAAPKSKMADRHYAGSVRGRKAVYRSGSGLL
ncbi:hypothetical protein SDC9_124728 [bioreactor metagenome]|uniref:HTH-like domain-containing protein n=1 Tax=bioreactor metagenome TaxID=1076179 RepID=A0A645CL45_9ZZZZ